MSLLAIPSGTSSNAGGFYPYAIDGSLRFNDDDGAYLTRTPASSGNRKTWTLSLWVKRGNLGTSLGYIYRIDSTSTDRFEFDSSDRLFIQQNDTTIRVSTQRFRDPSAWYHIVLAMDTTQATANDRTKVYVNGEQITAWDTITNNSQNTDGRFNLNALHRLGGNGTNYFDGYMAEINFIDGTALTPSSFGETLSGVWVPKAYSGSYGTNGFYLKFDGNVNDSAGSNNWTANNITSDDYVSDSPTDNFATWNPLFKGGEKSSSISATTTLSDGNLKASVPTNSYMGATMRPSSGQWYCEATIDTVTNEVGWGWIQATEYSGATAHAGVADKWGAEYSGYAPADIFLRDETTAIAQPVITLSNGDVIQWAWDIDNGKGWIGVDNDWYDSSGGTTGSPATGANPTFTFTADEAENLQVYVANGTGTAVFTANFGQQSFTYTPPSGYLALSTANLTVAEGVDPAGDNNPADYFNTVLYTGNGSTQSITGVGFEPDWVWIKERSSTSGHVVFDQVRGATESLFPDNTGAESTTATQLTSFDTDGFTTGSSGGTNQSGQTYVAWNWKANGSGVSNTDGDITSTVSANTESGFSIVSYTGTGSAGATIGHGLGVAPAMIITKNRSTSSRWAVYHHANTSQPETEHLRLNETTATIDATTYWNDTTPTSSVFTVGTDASVNGTGNNMIAYCFHSVDGFSKFGSYAGTDSADGPFIYTGFRPSLVIVKCTTNADDWCILDSERDSYNVADALIKANGADAELEYTSLDMLSNGFKLRVTNSFRLNKGGASFIYMAFAENPFKYANAR